MTKHLIIAVALSVGIVSGCKDESAVKPAEGASLPNAAVAEPPAAGFSNDDARANLVFSKEQYLQLIAHVDAGENVELASKCRDQSVICFPRSEEHGKIFLEKPEKWTNGFYPGVLWMLLQAAEDANVSDAERAKLYEKATFYQDGLFSEAHRKTTHDLGFILDDSFGNALLYDGLTEEQKTNYAQALVDGRNSLATRYYDEQGVIKSWDWVPNLRVQYMENGEQKKTGSLWLNKPWQYPVIVDNMMNLEYMLGSTEKRHHEIAYMHAATTMKNHFHYFDSDTEKKYPVAYHVFDYGTMRPGNWQGVGNISAWARGQGWSFYGYVTVAEAAIKQGAMLPEGMPDFLAYTETLYGTLSELMKDDPVPIWDFMADWDTAHEVAKNQSDDTAIFHHTLDLCDYEIPSDTLPYKGYSPILMDASLFTDETIGTLKGLKPVRGDSFLVKGEGGKNKVAVCGTEPYDLTGRTIPKDTSAAALIASAMYRLAGFVDDSAKREKYIAFGDRIMADLTQKYRTDVQGSVSHKLGFLLEEATGNLPNGSEINSSIVYADYYFIEANMRKLALSQ